MSDNNLVFGEERPQDAHELNLRDDIPVWFLDIDGVINSYPAPKAHMVKKYGEYRHEEILGYPIWYSPDVVSFINQVNALEMVEVVWLTTWVQRALTDFAPVVGLDPFPCITSREGSDFPFLQDWWKWNRVKDFLQFNEANRPVVWTDDDLSRPIKANFRARFPETPACLVTPQSCPGLRTEDLDRILEFLKNPVQA